MIEPIDIFPEWVLARVVHGKSDPHDAVIDRRTSWGNPFSLSDYDGDRLACLFEYVDWLTLPKDPGRHDPLWHPRYRPTAVMENVGRLSGKVLGCWCAPRLCHGHVLAQLSEASRPYEEASLIAQRVHDAIQAAKGEK